MTEFPFLLPNWVIMSKYFVCCEQCFESIGKRNTAAAKFWMDICTLQMNRDATRIDANSPKLPELRHLELLGFVVSTDWNDCILVKAKGYFINSNGHYFCIKGGRHET